MRVAAVLLLCSGLAVAQEPSPPVGRDLSPAKLKRVSQAVDQAVQAGTIPGGVVLVACDGKVRLASAHGYMDREAKTPAKRDTIFRIYSMTKPITVAAALQLVERRLLGLDDPVSKHLPAFKGLRPAQTDTPKDARPMTIRDLMRHTSGLTYGWGTGPVEEAYRKANPLDPKSTTADLVQKLSKIPLAHPPGTVWEYSLSTDVLGRVVEVVSGERLDRYFQKHIFAPLKMVDTGFHVPRHKLHRFAANYKPAADGLALLDAPGTSRFARPASLHSGGGGLVSTADDYLAFGQALLHGGAWKGARILRRASVRAMTKNQLPKSIKSIRFGNTPIPGMSFGLGVSVVTGDLGAFGVRGEFGWAGAATTTFFASPRDRLVAIVMTQVMPRTMALDMKLRPLIYNARRRGPM